MNPRAIKEADALALAGYDVHLIATRLSHDLDALDKDIFDKASWSVEIVDFSSKSIWLRERGLTWLAQKLCSVFKPLSKRFFFAKLAHSPLTRRLMASARRQKAELFIAHYPAALPAAAFAARRSKSVYAYDAEDFHLGDLSDTPENKIKNNYIETIERTFIEDAAYISAAAPGIADAYVQAYGVSRPTVVLNTFPIKDAPKSALSHGTVEPGPSLYWFSQVRGRDRGLENALDAIARTKSKVHLYIRGGAQSGFDKALRARATELNCSARLHFLEPAKPSEMMQLAAHFDVGLSGETGVTKNRQVALPNKHFTYLLAGIPVVMSDIPAHAEFAKDIPHVCKIYQRDNPQSLADALDDLLLDPERLADTRKAAFEIGQTRYNWERESKRLLALVSEATD